MVRETASQKAAREAKEAKRRREALCNQYQIQDVLVFQTPQGVRHGHLVQKIGAFFKVRHPDGSTYSIEVEQVIRTATHCHWPGLADTLIQSESFDMIERWITVLGEMEAGASSVELQAIRQLLKPLAYARAVVTRVVDYYVLEVKEASPEHLYIVNNDRYFDDILGLFKLEKKLVTPMDTPDEGVVWFRETVTGYCEVVER